MECNFAYFYVKDAVIIKPMITPTGDARIKNVSQTDFYFSAAKESAQTGIKIQLKT